MPTLKKLVFICTLLLIVILLAQTGAGSRPAGPSKPSWRILSLLNYETGEIPPIIQRMNGKVIRVAGYIVPLDDDQDSVSEFLLVPYQGACIHAPPPPPNQMIHVHMLNQKVPYTWKAVWIEGRLTVSAVDSPYGKVAYSMEGFSTLPFEGSKRDESYLGI